MLRITRQLVEAGILAAAVFFTLQLSIQTVVVKGNSMEPTLDDGGHVMINKLVYYQLDLQRVAKLVPFWDVDDNSQAYLPFSRSPERGEVVVFENPSGTGPNLVKRVIGLPGERVELKDGTVFIDGVKLDEPYLAGMELTGYMECIPGTMGCVLQQEAYFVMGDNRGRSNDSRHWGPVPLEDIVGKVWFEY